METTSEGVAHSAHARVPTSHAVDRQTSRLARIAVACVIAVPAAILGGFAANTIKWYVVFTDMAAHGLFPAAAYDFNRVFSIMEKAILPIAATGLGAFVLVFIVAVCARTLSRAWGFGLLISAALCPVIHGVMLAALEIGMRGTPKEGPEFYGAVGAIVALHWWEHLPIRFPGLLMTTPVVEDVLQMPIIIGVPFLIAGVYLVVRR